MKLKCKCGNERRFALRPVGTHRGLYCTSCERWQKWITAPEYEWLITRDVQIPEVVFCEKEKDNDETFGDFDDFDRADLEYDFDR